MALANLLAYVVVFGLPLWLLGEELIHRFAVKRDFAAPAPARSAAPATASADLERRAPEGVRVHASFV